MVEALLFAAAEPLTLREMEARMPPGCDPAEALQLLRKRYDGRGVTVAARGRCLGDPHRGRPRPS
jgi:segregation and condensation protein B